MDDDISASKDERLKPKTVCFYDKTKGAVDVVDAKIKKYTKMKTKKDLGFGYIWDLRKRLVVPHIRRRYESPVGLQKLVVDKMRNILKATTNN